MPPHPNALKALMLSNQPAATHKNIPLGRTHDCYGSLCKAHVYPPFIDNIVLVGKLFPDDVANGAKQAQHTPKSAGIKIKKHEHEEYLDSVIFNASNWLPSKDAGFLHPGKAVPGYRHSGQKKIGTDDASLLISIPGKSQLKGGPWRVRIEFNPSKIGGAKGLSAIHAAWDNIFCHEIAFGTWLQRAQATALDVAVDIVSVPITDLIPEYKSNHKWSYWLSAEKKVETITTWKFSGEKKHKALLIYNKKQELLDGGHEPFAGDADHVRVERRLRNQKIGLHKLDKLANPFGGLVLHHTPTVAAKHSAAFRLFLHSTQTIGLEAALKLQSDKVVRAQWKHAFEHMPPAGFWLPQTSWKFWTKSLNGSGLQTWIDAAKPTL